MLQNISASTVTSMLIPYCYNGAIARVSYTSTIPQDNVANYSVHIYIGIYIYTFIYIYMFAYIYVEGYTAICQLHNNTNISIRITPWPTAQSQPRVHPPLPPPLVILYHTILYYSTLCYAILYCTILCYIILYYIL